jgi:hypothetical protein
VTDARVVLEVVEVIDEERIVERGTAQVNWFVRLNDAWVHVSTWPAARSERLDAGAGTVWQSRTELDLPRGARLMRVESRPNTYARGTPLEYLTQRATIQSRNSPNPRQFPNRDSQIRHSDVGHS